MRTLRWLSCTAVNCSRTFSMAGTSLADLDCCIGCLRIESTYFNLDCVVHAAWWCAPLLRWLRILAKAFNLFVAGVGAVVSAGVGRRCRFCAGITPSRVAFELINTVSNTR